MKTEPQTAEQMARKALAWLQAPAGRAALRRSHKRIEAMAELLKRTRPTKETWEWTADI